MTKNFITYSSQNYADALFKTGQNFAQDLNIVSEALKNSNELLCVISNPSIALNLKNEILTEIFSGKVCDEVLQFIKILTEKNRLADFEEIKAAYFDKIHEAQNVQIVEITSAIELNEDLKTKITKKLSEKLEKTIFPEWQVDREIISGLVFKMGDDLIDLSLKSRMEHIEKNIR